MISQKSAVQPAFSEQRIETLVETTGNHGHLRLKDCECRLRLRIQDVALTEETYSSARRCILYTRDHKPDRPVHRGAIDAPISAR